jgi:ABC-2 type transport system permease protein
MLLRFLEPEKLARPEGMDAVAQYLSYLDAPTAVFLPSWWITASVFSLLGKNLKTLALYCSMLVGCAVFLFYALYATADKIFLKGWAENQSVQKRKTLQRHSYSVMPPAAALFLKDLKVFFRDANQWSQLLILGSLCAVYVFSIYKIPLNTEYLRNLVAFFNVGLISFVVSAVALRFVFPAVSLEGDSFWILKSAPFKPSGLLAMKTLFGAVPVVFIAAALAVASGLILKVEPVIFWASTAAVFVLSCGLNFMAAGFGAIFPRFNMTSVAQIETSHGGLLYILSAVFYIGLNIGLLAMPLQNYYRIKLGGQGIPWTGFVLSIIGIIILNAAAIVVPFKLGAMSLKRIEL